MHLCSGIGTAYRADASTQNAITHVNLRASCPRSRKQPWLAHFKCPRRSDGLFVSPRPFRHNSPRRSNRWESVSASLFHGLGHRRRRNTRNRSGIKNHWDRQIWRASDWDLWKYPKPATEGARNASCNLSGTKDRWGAARFRAASFFIFYSRNFFTGHHA